MVVVGAGWLAIAAAVTAASVLAGAAPSTSALLLAVCVTPPGVALLMGLGAPGPTIAEVLRAVETGVRRGTK